jgi:hypothetical protein
LPDPVGADPAASEHQGKGSASSDLGAWGPSHPTPQKWYGLARPRGCGVGLGQGPSPPPTATNMRCGPKTMPLMLGRGRAHLDVAGGHHKLYLGTHVPNSVGRADTVLLDPRATLERGSVDHTACQEGMERRGQVAAPTYRTSDGQGTMTKDGDARL